MSQPAGRADFIKFFPQEDRDKNPVPDFFPALESLPGYVEWVESLVRMLSQCEQRPPSDVIGELLSTNVDATAAKDAKDTTSG